MNFWRLLTHHAEQGIQYISRQAADSSFSKDPITDSESLNGSILPDVLIARVGHSYKPNLFRIWEAVFKAQAELETEVLIK